MAIQFIESERFYLRELSPSDATIDYLNWIKESNYDFIVSANKNFSIFLLKEYIQEKKSRESILFFGIFLKNSAKHIGNLKYENLNSFKGEASMGILIGEECWRGKGVAVEVIYASSKWLYHHLDIKKILLGVNIKNTKAIKVYKKIGFVVVNKNISPEGFIFNMEWEISSNRSLDILT